MSLLSAKKFLPLVASALLVTAVASSARAAEATTEYNDPWESMNRGIFAFNRVADTYLLRPVAAGYRYVTPQLVRTHLGNFADNLSEPLNGVNALLQGDVVQGVQSFWRFIINSTIGLAGLNDVATVAGIPQRDEDFGQTLAVWGVGSGPYLVLPILGPSSVRDAGGRVGNWVVDPVNYVVDSNVAIGIAVGQGIVQRERLIDPIDDIFASSLDPYVSFRSIYQQRRKAQIENRSVANKPSVSLPE